MAAPGQTIQVMGGFTGPAKSTPGYTYEVVGPFGEEGSPVPVWEDGADGWTVSPGANQFHFEPANSGIADPNPILFRNC